MFLYYTRGMVRWVGGVHCGDMGAMKAEGQARLEPPRNPGYAHTGYCVLAEGYVESEVVGSFEDACNGSSDSTQLYTDVIRISMILRCTLVQ